MKAAIAEGIGTYLLEDVELLPLGPTDVRVRTIAALACVTDVHARRNGGSPGLAKPHIRGHAGIGEVLEVGDRVRRTQVGDRVVVVSRPQCGTCWWCLHDQPYECDTTVAPPPAAARRANGDLLQGSARVGSYAEEMRVAEATVVPVDTTLSDDELLMLSCGATTGFGAAFNTVPVRPGQNVLVMGAGIIGLSVAQAARVGGAENVVLVEPQAARRDHALAGHATHAVADAEEARELLADLTSGRGADVAFEAVGTPAALQEAFMLTRRAGDVVGIGFGHWDDQLVLPFNQVTLRNKRLSGCQFGSASIIRDIPDYARRIELGQLEVASLVGKRFSLDEINEALDAQEACETLGAIVVP
ncbi:zinc-binding dehydrogenase [Nocardioides marmotae]|uniref:Zinc-binding dehydrogenase n=1 Tax=Nocardioides marmotae TaxID=2663857 RepID=A0A6I3J9B9_9ACTN|nr:zinc-binding dehydrogenase [Nocardioides marmotae]MCR6030266.1 zinc-binding dehydrogenase [Gordonia jinghuaiqii]MBC9734443.1 zinc-binding dehydrogenase [Nocardioides marmotae]MTB85543.1 zinc-binding dehydrogenase [Nocardioides marmotae]MTB93898.1 zinc-binding dehydrogenase [Nocardioides marmotae]QKE00219.1 zinc-binding dehydrogenase [Nocardioides marmotae]